MNNKDSYTDRKYDIQPYDPNWPDQFAVYAEKIKNIFGDIQIEHIGSTSVPGTTGKPCIDVLVIVPDLQIVEDHISEMEQVGFQYAGQFVMEGSRLFRVMNDNIVLANIHFFTEGHSHNQEMLSMRDYLRSHPEEVKAYSDIKAELYSKYPNDYASYRKYKDEYMDGLKKRVEESKSNTIKVVVECQAGSDTKHVFDEVTLEDKESFTVSRNYPFPYGFIQATKSGDGDCLDCFVLTKQPLDVKQIVDVEVIGMFEQFETRDGITKEDHNILAKLKGEDFDLTDEVKEILREFVLHVWDHRVGKKVEVGSFYGKLEADLLIKKSLLLK